MFVLSARAAMQNAALTHGFLSAFKCTKSLLRLVLILLFASTRTRHIWGYLRVVFTSMNRMDLSELSSSENTQTIADKLGITLIHPQ